MTAQSSDRERVIACLDMRSFYASCAAVEHGLDPLRDCIAVVANLDRNGSVVLAVSPEMKRRFGVRTGTRLYEIPGDPDIYLLEPKMDFFLEVSMEITKLIGEYVPKTAIHVYSVDECFIDLTGTEKLWGPPEETIRHIQDELYRQFQLPSAAGVGPNMLLAKLSLDLEAKKTGFAWWRLEDVPEKLWPVTPLSEMWGIGSRMEYNLNSMGIFSVGDLAQADLKQLEERFGVIGHQLYQHAHGIDFSYLREQDAQAEPVSFSKGQMLYRDYITEKDIMTVLLEMCEEVARRAREAGKAGRMIHLGIGYSKAVFGGGFSRSKSIDEATNDTMQIYRVCQALFHDHYQDKPVRSITVSVGTLEDETSMQLSLFEAQKWRRRKLAAVMDAIRRKYGSTALLRAVSYTEAGTAVSRAGLLGGHKKREGNDAS
ncbi:Y-family DNA polymerase [Planococcus lenghuensis]|uniref:UV damage repair protein UvrX n=1 Tax=Planococcus lenghuensis TaxID=2213202 RepID=A0A1Q2L2P1_9BACL|nr:UV damage repair protein UvrX [Planococcus lenghuensis]AQQ54728.1 UV damage repair protein UvrX [Planococcus lenghuensis]